MMTEKGFKAYLDGYEAAVRFGARYRADESLRARIDGGDYGDLELEVPAGAAVRVVHQTPEVYFMLMPEQANSALADQELGSVAGGAAGCLASAMCMTSMSMGGCVSSGASAGTANPTG